MAVPVVDVVLVNLIGDHQQVAFLCQRGDLAQRRFGQHRACRVVWRDDHQRFGTRGERRFQVGGADGEIRLQSGGNRHQRPAQDSSIAGVLVVVRGRSQRLVTRIEQRHQHRHQRFLCAGGHQHLAVGINGDAVFRAQLLGDGRAQFGDARPGRVLHSPGVERLMHGLEDCGRRQEVRRTAAQVDQAGDGDGRLPPQRAAHTLRALRKMFLEIHVLLALSVRCSHSSAIQRRSRDDCRMASMTS